MKPVLIIFFAAGVLCGQLEPGSSHVLLYFPHFADGGTREQQWQTRFTFYNPSGSIGANLTLEIYGDDGLPLAINFGSGARTSFEIYLPPNGTTVLTSSMSSSAVIQGWAVGLATAPVQGNVAFRMYEGGAAKLELTAPPSLPTFRYVSFANSLLGVAVVNPNSYSLTVQLTLRNQAGGTLGSRSFTLAPNAHSSFNLNSKFPDIPATASIEITTTDTRSGIVAWTVYSDESGIISTLPDGKLGWPNSQWEQIWLAYIRVFNAAQFLGITTMGVNLNSPPATSLRISYERVLNARAFRDGRVEITVGLAELMSDSQSELAFIIAHEIGHIFQYKLGSNAFSQNVETDADQIGMLVSLAAGYDPYAAAGALAKLSMASGKAGLLSQFYDDLSSDPHYSFGTRIENVFDVMLSICADPDFASFCSQYKDLIHPHFPPGAPLGIGLRQMR